MKWLSRWCNTWIFSSFWSHTIYFSNNINSNTVNSTWSAFKTYSFLARKFIWSIKIQHLFFFLNIYSQVTHLIQVWISYLHVCTHASLPRRYASRTASLIHLTITIQELSLSREPSSPVNDKKWLQLAVHFMATLSTHHWLCQRRTLRNNIAVHYLGHLSKENRI